MEYVRFAVRFTAFALLVVLVGGYIVLVYRGDIPAPNLQALANQVAPSLSAGGSIIVVVGIAICCVLTAIAPFIYAARSGDFFTIIVSIVSLVVCFALLTASRTVIDMVLAAIVYSTSALLSVVVYSTNRIVETIRKSGEAHFR
ncbi:hypothetical protein ABIF90_008110 [Bradyrhizobium japonicum]